MGERKGTNKYYPPDFDPKKHGSLAGYTKQHPLRERARKLSQGILIIRFEMPYNIWCEGCKNPIGMGVRYNAEKSKIGNYYTTPIYKFRMKCHLCDMHFEIKTDPANHDYVIISGARRKEQRWDPKENEQVVPEDRETHKKLATDAMYKLEHASLDSAKLPKKALTLSSIAESQEQWKDDYTVNKLAREKFRNEKKEMKANQALDNALLAKASLDISLVPESNDDVVTAKLLRITHTKYKTHQERLKASEERPIFSTGNLTPSPSSSKSPMDSPGQSQSRLGKVCARLGLTRSNNAAFSSTGSPASTHKRSQQSVLGAGIIIKKRKLSDKTSTTETTVDTENANYDEDKHDVKLKRTASPSCHDSYAFKSDISDSTSFDSDAVTVHDSKTTVNLIATRDITSDTGRTAISDAGTGRHLDKVHADNHTHDNSTAFEIASNNESKLVNDAMAVTSKGTGLSYVMAYDTSDSDSSNSSDRTV